VVDENGRTQFVITADQQQERDRLTTNLALYQQIYSSLLQSYELVRLAEIQGTSTVRLVEEATPPTRPVRPNVFQDTALAAVVGLILGVGLVFGFEMLNDTVKDPEEVARQLGLPVLGYISEIEESNGWPVAAEKPRTPIAEAFRSLRTNIQYASVDRPLRTILVTSPLPQDGKSVVATNLATVIAQSGKQVILLDSDLRRPSLHTKLQMANRTGLSDLFVQADGSENYVRETKVPGLGLVTSGALPPNPAELVGSEKMVEIMNQLLTQADVLVVDTPPVMAVTDAAVLASRVDGVLLVLQPGATKLTAARQTVETLMRSGANVLGVVLNRIGNRSGRYYYYYRHYYDDQHYYAEPHSADKKGKRLKKRRVSS
jgi:capsular exopolysaccharide synthesis family protein